MTHRARMHGYIRSLKQNLRTDPGVEGPLQWGTIASISTGGSFDTCGVYLDSASGQPGAVITTGIPWINGYKPTVGDVVLILRMGGAARTQRVILGPLETVNHGLTQAGVEDVTSLVSAGPITLPPSTGGTIAATSYSSMPVKINENQITGSASTTLCDFQNIPNNFRHLRLIIVVQSSSGAPNALLRFQNDSSGAYNYNLFEDSGTGALSGNILTGQTGIRIATCTTPVQSTWSTAEVLIPMYASGPGPWHSARSIATRWDSNSAPFINIINGNYTGSSNALNRIQVVSSTSDTFSIGSIATLEGIP